MFNDQEKLDNEAAGQTSLDETDEWEVNEACVNECWMGDH